jgi:hypothetical protein
MGPKESSAPRPTSSLTFVNKIDFELRRASEWRVVEATGQFSNTEEGERHPLEAVTRRLMKTVTEGINVLSVQ